MDSGFMGVKSTTPDDQSTFISADSLISTGDEETRLNGNVDIQRQKMRLRSDSVLYSPLTDRATARGNVVIEQDGMVLRAPEGQVKLGTQASELNTPTFELNTPRFVGKGRADKLNYDGISTLTLENPNYTVCAVPDPSQADKGDWYISARQLEVDQVEEVGKARDAKVVFKDVPILATPYLSFPTSDKRKSGFLPPSIGTVSNSGLEITTPYYLNVAPDKDITLFPKLITGRGAQLGAETRYLTPTQTGVVKFDYLPDDKKRNDSRYAYSVQQRYNEGNYVAGLNLNGVSDDQYFVDFSRTQAVASQRVLMREGYFGYREQNWSANIRAVTQQTLQLFNDVITEPYDRLPEASVELYPTRVGPAFLSVSGLYTDFANPARITNRVEGSRGVTRARLFMPINKAQFSITPAVSIQSNNYSLRNQTTGQTSAPNTVIPTASLDGTVYFDRQTTLFGRAVTQTLEPRLFYLYTPFRDQSAQPLFDTTVTDQSLSRIFSENRYAGLDRVGDANQITAAVTSRFSDSRTGEELFSLTGGQRVNLKTPRLVLPGLEPLNPSDSDFFANVRGRIRRDIFVDATSQFSAETGKHQRGNFTVGYSPSPGKQLNTGYRYTRNQIDQFDVSGQWPISQRLSGVGRLNYSLLDDRLIEGVAGLEYSEGCWVLRVVAQRFATAPQLETTSLFVQLELSGLGRIGSNPLLLLSRQVPGYTPFASTPLTQSTTP
ncbi:MAG: LPS-assembly protein LptD [Limnobacter sp.]|uniref:LPS-assembly protein LptD n=1 Tax=Limnobacter sp. TaxID=2003368 RepID=UPI00391CD9E3